MNRRQLGLALFVGGPCLAFLTWRRHRAEAGLGRPGGRFGPLAPTRAGSGHQARRGIADDTLGRWERQFPTVRQTVRRHPATSPDSGAATTRSGARLVLASFSTTSSTLGDCVEPDNNFRAFTSVQGGADGQDFNCSSAVTAGTECSVEETTGFSNCSVNDSSDHPGCSAGQWPGAGGVTTGCSAINTSGGASCSAFDQHGGNHLMLDQLQQRRNRP